MKAYSLALAALTVSSATALADTPFRISNPTVDYTRTWTTSKTKAGTTTVEAKASSYKLRTASFEPEFRIKHNDMNFYLAPAMSAIGFGMNMEMLEVGAWVSLSQSAPASATVSGATSRHALAVFGKYAMPMGDNELELMLKPSYSMGSTAAPAGGKEVSMSGFGVGLGAKYICKVTERFEVAHGLGLKWTSETTKDPMAGVDELAMSVTELKVSLADFRLKF